MQSALRAAEVVSNFQKSSEVKLLCTFVSSTSAQWNANVIKNLS